MASADDDIGIPPMPALPPIGGIADLLSGDEFPGILLGQNSPPGAAAGVEDTPPIRRINVHSDEPSAMSGMTTPNTATAAVRKRSSAYDDDDDDEPSPKKALPDFSICKGEEDSVMSGDDSEGWLDMEEKLADNLSAQAKVDDALDEAAFPDIPMWVPRRLGFLVVFRLISGWFMNYEVLNFHLYQQSPITIAFLMVFSTGII